MRYFITFAYNGTAYHGWQYQPNAITVQEVLEDRMSRIAGDKICLTAAGRTDAGVHASEMTAHFDFDINDISDFIFRLNGFLPADIAVKNIVQVKNDAHARFDAVSRTYNYILSYKKNPFQQDTCWYYKYGELNIDRMNEAANVLSKHSDFTSFARLHADNKTNICKISHAKWTIRGTTLKFEISADRFLRNMVRAIVGTLVEVGQEKIGIEEFIDIIDKKDRKFAGASAPAQGLFLTKVRYPDDIFL